MNQLENNSRNRSASPGRSRAKGADRGRSASGRASSRGTSSRNTGHGGSRSSSSYRSGQAGRMNAMQNVRRNSRRHRRKGPDYKWIAIGGVILIVVITCIAMALNGKNSDETGVQATTEAVTETEMKKEVSVDGISITGLSKSQAREVLLKEFPWSMTVSYDSEVYEVNDLMAGKIDSLLNEIYSGEPQESYTLDTAGLEEQIKAEAAACAAKWDKKAKNGSIDSFNAETGKFVFAGEENGFAIDQEKLIDDITQALAAKDFDTKIEASGSTVAPEITAASAKEQYKTIGSFTTNTTSNKNRNTNVRLAAEAINGTVIKPGHEFSFNGTVGQRTEAKGYKGAAAYNNGEVVQEIGGGVCQVSTTLYNAVFKAGLKISYRRSHTFEPNYVTPGRDATVSYEQPDFKFINTSSTAIGLRASYADQKMTVSVYGIPILEDGITWDLESKKVEDLGVPEPEYVEDQTLDPGVEKTTSKGSSGSRWETYKVVYKDGKEISRELDHKTTYKGHKPVVHRNTSGVVLNPEETTTQATTVTPTVDGMPEGYTGPAETTQSQPGSGTASSAPAEGPGSASTEPSSVPVAPAPSEDAPSGSQGGPGAGAVVVPVKPE
ncbi:VanW family protein [Enterocloster sp. HCN-30185]|uniref:VanW family protein n=1 Tax=Enterocloster sp. HCN-30185 TaxID=3134663 RepID=UPI0030BFD147